ncbi:TonB-dependent hemoglobin/transferrin/lactoferrin family receptor [Brevundimonas sp.]|uniref:TonB-dependent hemoglobin/transferrin/lactoferrin family receptor n=1 Tax=Brevundimonas sp. TaxID=1871086 RepID=UPI0035B339CC
MRLFATTSLLALTLAVPAMAAEDNDQPTRLDEITVVATREPIRVDQAPATVTVFTAESIEALLATDIKDLIRFEPGVSVVSQPARFGAALGTTGRAGNAGFTIRGLGGDRVLMVVDGVRVPDGYVFGAQSVGRGGYSDLDLMERVEILRGPASALYGSDGVAGAVSFTTRDPEGLIRPDRDIGARARVAYGSADQSWAESLAVAGRAGSISGLLSYTRRDAQETETQGTVGGEGSSRTEANPQDLVSNAILGKLVWQVAPQHRLRLTYDHYDMTVDADVLSGRVPAASPFSPNAVLELLATDETERDRLSLDWRVDDAFGLDRGQATVYWQDATTRQFTFEDRDPAVDRTRLNTFDNRVWGVAADALKTFAFGGVDHRVTFGGDWSETRQEGLRDGTVPPTNETFPVRAFPNTDYRLSGLFIQDDIRLLDGALSLIPALRLDAYELTPEADPLYPDSNVAGQSDERVSPKLGAVFWADDHFGLFGNVGAGFKAPTPSQVNNFFSNPAFGYTSLPNPDLGPETSVSAEIGMRFRDLDILGGLFSLQVAAFKADYEDFISQEVVSGSFTPQDPAVYQFVNLAEVETHGIEARGRLLWDNGFSADFSASYAKGRQSRPELTADLPSVDPIKLVGGLAYDDPAGRFGGQAIVTWSDEKDGDLRALGCGTTCFTGEAFTLLDVTAYWNVTDLVTARVGVFNLTDETYSWWSDIAGVSATSAITDAFTQPGRNVSVSLSLRY